MLHFTQVKKGKLRGDFQYKNKYNLKLIGGLIYIEKKIYKCLEPT